MSDPRPKEIEVPLSKDDLARAIHALRRRAEDVQKVNKYEYYECHSLAQRLRDYRFKTSRE